MSRFTIQLLLEEETWSNRYYIPKNDQYIDSLTQCTKIISNFTEDKYGKTLIYDEVDSAHDDKCFSKFTKTHSIQKWII